MRPGGSTSPSTEKPVIDFPDPDSPDETDDLSGGNLKIDPVDRLHDAPRR